MAGSARPSQMNSKLLKIIHLLSVASVFGGLLSILSVLLMKKGLVQPDPAAFTYDVILLNLHTWAVTLPFSMVVATSLIYGLFTEWGFIRHYWILAKWVLVGTLFTLTMIALGPSLSGMASISDAGFYIRGMTAKYDTLQGKAITTTILELIGLVVLFTISILKPWGRQRKYDIKRKTALWVILPLAVMGGVFGIANAMMLNGIRNMEIRNVDLNTIGDGSYRGSAEIGNYGYEVRVVIKDHRISSIQDLKPRKGTYAEYARGVFNKIVRSQKVNVDAVTGATTTSKAYMKAVENALEGAGKN